MPPRSATVLGPDEGPLFDAAGDRYRFLATRELTDGKYGLWEAIVPPGGGPPPHRHTREEEGFYVVEGEVTIVVDGRRVTATAGSFVNMPVGSTHWFKNETSRPAKLLVLVAPGGMEGMFRITGRPVADQREPIAPMSVEEKERLVVTAPQYGIELQLPPGGPPHA